MHDIHELLLTALKQLDIAGRAAREALRDHVRPLSEAVREVYRAGRDAKPFGDGGGASRRWRSTSKAPCVKRNLGTLGRSRRGHCRWRATRPFFDAMEKAQPGSGGLFSVAIDPWKCSGCLECIDVCGPGALKEAEQDAALLETLQTRFEFLSRTPNTPARFIDGAIEPEGDTKRLMLDRHNYYATTGGHGACRGCGEVTAIRLVVAANHAIHDRRRKEHIRELEGLIADLEAKLPDGRRRRRPRGADFQRHRRCSKSGCS